MISSSFFLFILSDKTPATGHMNMATRDKMPDTAEAAVISAPKVMTYLVTRGTVIKPAAPFPKLMAISIRNFHVHSRSAEELFCILLISCHFLLPKVLFRFPGHAL